VQLNISLPEHCRPRRIPQRPAPFWDGATAQWSAKGVQTIPSEAPKDEVKDDEGSVVS